MCVDQQNEHEIELNASINVPAGNVPAGNVPAGMRVDIVDSWHKCWPMVLKEIEHTGGREKLMVDSDGWLSARQCLLVAFNKDNAIAGHLVFRIQPMFGLQDVMRVPIEAHQDDLGIRPGFSEDEVRKLLIEAATEHAKSLRVRRLVDFG